METLMSALIAFVVIVIIGDVFGSFGARLLTRPGVDPPVWAAPLIRKWEQLLEADDVYFGL